MLSFRHMLSPTGETLPFQCDINVTLFLLTVQTAQVTFNVSLFTTTLESIRERPSLL